MTRCHDPFTLLILVSVKMGMGSAMGISISRVQLHREFD